LIEEQDHDSSKRKLLSTVSIVVWFNVDVGDPRCPIHGEDTIFTHKL